MPGLFIERHARSVSKYVDVAVLYVHPEKKNSGDKYAFDYSTDDEITQLKIYYKADTASSNPFVKLANLWHFIHANIKGFNYLKRKHGNPGLIHVNVLTRLGVIAWIYKLFTGTPYVITEHWTRYLPMTDTFRGWFRKLMTRIVARNADAILPVTDNLRRAMESYGLTNRRYRIIPNVVDTNMFRPAAEKFENEKGVMVHVSCFEDKQKNISGLLRVFKRLSEVRGDWKANLVGDGIHFEKLNNLAGELGLKGKFVEIHGLKENEELVELMRNAHFQVMFSRFENLPVVILESYSCGVPVLSTDVGGISEHMNDELGLLIPSEDEEALFNSLNKMLDNRNSYNREKIRDYALGHFSKEVIGRQLFDVYKEVTSH
jgi:glycosyltransferase involved in cell wall biosynthesis